MMKVIYGVPSKTSCSNVIMTSWSGYKWLYKDVLLMSLETMKIYLALWITEMTEEWKRLPSSLSVSLSSESLDLERLQGQRVPHLARRVSTIDCNVLNTRMTKQKQKCFPMENERDVWVLNGGREVLYTWNRHQCAATSISFFTVPVTYRAGNSETLLPTDH